MILAKSTKLYTWREVVQLRRSLSARATVYADPTAHKVTGFGGFEAVWYLYYQQFAKPRAFSSGSRSRGRRREWALSAHRASWLGRKHLAYFNTPAYKARVKRLFYDE
jgi:hypothetical protein